MKNMTHFRVSCISSLWSLRAAVSFKHFSAIASCSYISASRASMLALWRAYSLLRFSVSKWSLAIWTQGVYMLIMHKDKSLHKKTTQQYTDEVNITNKTGRYKVEDLIRYRDFIWTWNAAASSCISQSYPRTNPADWSLVCGTGSQKVSDLHFHQVQHG